MTEPRLVDGAPALLFERLVDLEPLRPSEPQPFRILSPKDLRSSIIREVARLLDTRRPVTAEEALDEQEATVLEYGIPDVSFMRPASLDDRQLAAIVIARAIRAFEPRLTEVKVKVDRDPQRHTGMVAVISGIMVSGTVVEPVSFPMELHMKTEPQGTNEPLG
jgi:type VI secretion system lysozyme-like protein